MIHLYTGDGKGKTTAAVGLATRARGHGERVLFVQFLKGGPTGEVEELERLGVDVRRLDRPCGFWYSLDPAAREAVVAEHNALLRGVLDELDGAAPPDLLVLDEFTYVYTTPMADPALCRQVLDAARKRGVELVLTGRNPGELAQYADYLSEIKAVRHPFDRGVPAREGVEF
ncbi:MAG TPA: hypothetical protein DDY72_02890 [Verrucomicrobia bacterium]|nr:hypothetical protein [Verrucomicrobiota bacterium]